MERSDFGFQIGSALATGYLTDSKFIRASFIVVDTISERNALHVDDGNGGVIVNGSLVYVTADSKFYQYNGTAWAEKDFGSIDDVQVNGTTIVNNRIANIPVANGTVLGVVKVDSTKGIGIGTSDNILYIIKASDSEIVAKTSDYVNITPSNLDIAIREGLGNNTLTWSSEYKSAARTTIGAGEPIIIEFLEEGDL